ncbi:MAG: adenylyltransferase/cytidyltransferase family protein, partial [Pseudomonadota bacterium]
GCFDVIHGGHVEFLANARQLGDRLVVCVAGNDVIRQHKGREPAMPATHRACVIGALRFVDDVEITNKGKIGLDFEPHLRRIRPDILAATDDDQYRIAKQRLCEQTGTAYATLAKGLTLTTSASSSAIRRRIAAPVRVPLRVDFAGGWLDVPALAREGCIVNCAIGPLVSLHDWPYEIGSGLGGSAAKSLLEGGDGLDDELEAGVGWQDPAVIDETGLCVWRSGARPVLDMRLPVTLLKGRMALLWTGARLCDCSDLTAHDRDYGLIVEAGQLARDAVIADDLERLADAIELSYMAQLKEGMKHLGFYGEAARKYCGGGWGGYALYLFATPLERQSFVIANRRAKAIEPYDRWGVE